MHQTNLLIYLLSYLLTCSCNEVQILQVCIATFRSVINSKRSRRRPSPDVLFHFITRVRAPWEEFWFGMLWFSWFVGRAPKLGYRTDGLWCVNNLPMQDYLCYLIEECPGVEPAISRLLGPTTYPLDNQATPWLSVWEMSAMCLGCVERVWQGVQVTALLLVVHWLGGRRRLRRRIRREDGREQRQ